MTEILAACVGYVAGSVPFAYLVTARRGRGDIRAQGSGNVGAANVQRVAGTAAAVLTALLDVAKGAVPVLAASAAGLGPEARAAAGVAAVVGHIYPVWLRFQGGKGVSTALGAALVWSPGGAVVAAALFVAAVVGTRTVSAGSVLAAAALGPLMLAWARPAPIVLAACAVGVLVIVRHRTNLIRLAAGTERRLY